MVKREVMLDEESNRVLESLAQDCGGDVGRVICELLRMHALPEADLDELERAQAEELTRQRDLSEREFREGKIVPWAELKRRCGL